MGASGKEPTCQCRRHERCEFPRVGRIPWRRALQLTPVFLPGESHGQRSLAGYSPWGCKESDTTEVTKHSCMHARHSQDYWGLAGIRAFLILVYFPSIWISIIYLGNPSPFQTELGFPHRCWKCRMVSFWVNSQWVSRWIRFSSQICHYSEGCSGHGLDSHILFPETSGTAAIKCSTPELYPLIRDCWPRSSICGICVAISFPSLWNKFH